MRKQCTARFVSAGIMLTAIGAAQMPSPIPTAGPTPIASRRPLADAADVLKHLYGKIITYEEPVLTWRGELEPQNGRDPSQKWAIAAKTLAFTMPSETGFEPNVGVLLERTLQEYHQQTAGTRFRVLTSDWGYHIVPAQVHDQTGTFVPAGSVLDVRVTVPAAARTPIQHYISLITAITGASGTKVESGVRGKPGGFDNVFRATPAQFKWGADDVVARDALIDLLKRSSTTMIWNLWCQPSAKAEDRFCVLNMSMLEVTITDPQGNRTNRVLKFDRCGDCPPVVPPYVAPPQPLKQH